MTCDLTNDKDIFDSVKIRKNGVFWLTLCNGSEIDFSCLWYVVISKWQRISQPSYKRFTQKRTATIVIKRDSLIAIKLIFPQLGLKISADFLSFPTWLVKQWLLELSRIHNIQGVWVSHWYSQLVDSSEQAWKPQSIQITVE